MNRPSRFLIAFCLAVLTVIPMAAETPPNIIFILADDMGWSDLGCYGGSFYETPNLDRLAKEGMRFTDSYAACNVCSPTRASIMTGKYPARLHLTDFLPNRPAKPSQKLSRPNILQQLPLEEVTIAEALKEAGYGTFFFGKWHLGSAGFFPEHQGFDVNIGGSNYGMPPTYFSPYQLPRISPGSQGEYLTDRLTSEAINVIEHNQDKPFFIYLSHYAVHVPLEAKAELVAKYQAKLAALPTTVEPEFIPDHGRQVRSLQRVPIYAAMMESLDDGVGRILAKLADLKLDKRTIVIFTSDNGGLSTAEGTPTSNKPLRMGKGWNHEGGIREPLIVKWPGKTAPGSVCSDPMISTDYYPTLLEMAGAPARPAQHLDGRSFGTLLRGANLPERPLFWHYPHYSNQGGPPCGAVRLGDWKLIEWYEDDHVELYNLKDDIGEKTDLSAKYPSKSDELRLQLHAWRASVDAQMPTPNPNYKPPAQ